MGNRRSRIRICFAVDSPYAGGAERYISLLASGLDRAAFEPSVMARTGTGLDAWCEELLAQGVDVVRVPMNMPFRPAHAVPVLRRLLELSPHLLHVNLPGPYDGQMGLLAPLARMAGCSRVVATEHLPRVEPLWKRALVKRIAYVWVDSVLTICRSNVDHLLARQRVAAHKIDVVYNGVPEAYGSRRDVCRPGVRERLGLDDNAVAMVFLGSLIERKGIGTLLDAVSGLGEDAWRLLVVGTGDRRDEYEDLARRRGLGGRVSFQGAVSEEGVEEMLCGADLLVVPSFMEGMPYVILEAMACSLPVVASRVDGVPEAVSDGETGVLVPVGEVDPLRVAIRGLIGDAPLRDRLGQNGRRRFENHFTLDRHIAHMELLYRDVLLGRR